MRAMMRVRVVRAAWVRWLCALVVLVALVGCDESSAGAKHATDTDGSTPGVGNIVVHPGGRWRLTLDPNRFWVRGDTEALHRVNDADRMPEEPQSDDDFVVGVRVVGVGPAGAPNFLVRIARVPSDATPFDYALGDIQRFQGYGMNIVADTIFCAGTRFRHYQRGLNEHRYLREREGYVVVVTSVTTVDDDTIRGDVGAIVASLEVL